MYKFLALVLVIVVLLILVAGSVNASKSEYQQVSEGVYDRVEYLKAGSILDSSSTVIHFEDGSAFIMEGRLFDIPFRKGTKIRILENTYFRGSYRIERAD